MVQTPLDLKKNTIAVVGLGYVGLPLAVEFAKAGFKVIGYDIDSERIKRLQNGFDKNYEVSSQELKKNKIHYTNQSKYLRLANFIIAAIPTPITITNQPDLSLLLSACKVIGENLSKGSIVVFESTVYPGVTEDICVPIIEKASSLKCGRDWQIGYSPERINPGDKNHTLVTTVKVVSGMDKESLQKIAKVYSMVCQNGIYQAPNIKTAEAAKVIENIQRDLNIALVNELSLIFHRLGLNTQEVLEAAGTKWNFLKFTPGLVGGHCIGVDPYYLVHKAEEIGYHPQVITAGRRVNDYMGEFVAELTIKGLIAAKKGIFGAKVLILGLTFKENIKDFRNSKIIVTIKKLKEFGVRIFGYDPHIKRNNLERTFEVKAIRNLSGKYDAVIIATPHQIFLQDEKKILKLLRGKPMIMDVKGAFKSLRKKRGIIYLSL